MPESRHASLLVSYYERFLRDQDIEDFRGKVSARYMEGTLIRLTVSGETLTRRAAVLALGLVGTFQANAAVGKALRDTDPTVRSLAENALWAVWSRSDSDENNAHLEDVARAIMRRQFDDAIDRAGRLIARAPNFAEAYNQRAIAEFHLGLFRESADDCRSVIERNPYHIGAFAGLAKCLLRLDRRVEALDVLKRSAKIQPFNADIRDLIAAIETGGE